VKVFPIDFILFQIDFIARDFTRIAVQSHRFKDHSAVPIPAIGVGDTCILRRYLFSIPAGRIAPAR
jgi:hypothetical protein